MLYLIITALLKIISPLEDLEKCSQIFFILNFAEAINSQKQLVLQIQNSLTIGKHLLTLSIKKNAGNTDVTLA